MEQSHVEKTNKSKLILAVMATIAMSFMVTGQLGATSGACFYPELAADIVIDNFEDQVGELPEDTKLCKQLCKKGRSTCQSQVQQASSCWGDYFNDVIGIEKLNDCKELEGDDKKECNQDLNTAKKEQKEFVKQSRENAADDCKDYFDNFCLASCEGEPL